MRARSGPIRALVCAAAVAFVAAASCAPRTAAEAKQGAAPVPAPTATAKVLAQFSHDPHAFTQGLIVAGNQLYESVGGYGTSDVREVALDTGKVLRRTAIAREQFGEGLARHGDALFTLTWQNGFGHRWRLPGIEPAGDFQYDGEGWGLASDGRHLILSDGSPELRIVDPDGFKVLRRITVADGGVPVRDLNELEVVDGEILANVWHTPRIARIDPKTGRVKGWIDLSAVVAATPRRDSEAVLNGIAWDAKARRLYVTGKHWPTLYRIAWPVD